MRVWNLATGGAVGDPFTGLHRLGDRAVAVAELDGRPVAVSGSDDRTTGVRGTEGTNRLIKDAARIAFGFRNLDNQRRRVRFLCTRQSRRTTSAEAAIPPQL